MVGNGRNFIAVRSTFPDNKEGEILVIESKAIL
jgi:hypothetical protein